MRGHSDDRPAIGTKLDRRRLGQVPWLSPRVCVGQWFAICRGLAKALLLGKGADADREGDQPEPRGETPDLPRDDQTFTYPITLGEPEHPLAYFTGKGRIIVDKYGACIALQLQLAIPWLLNDNDPRWMSHEWRYRANSVRLYLENQPGHVIMTAALKRLEKYPLNLGNYSLFKEPYLTGRARTWTDDKGADIIALEVWDGSELALFEEQLREMFKETDCAFKPALHEAWDTLMELKYGSRDSKPGD